MRFNEIMEQVKFNESLQHMTASSNPKHRALAGIEALRNLAVNQDHMANYDTAYIQRIAKGVADDLIRCKAARGKA